MTEVKKHREWTLCSNYSTDHDAMKWFVSRDSEVTPEVETPEILRVIEIIAVKELEAEIEKLKCELDATEKVYRMNRQYVETSKEEIQKLNKLLDKAVEYFSDIYADWSYKDIASEFAEKALAEIKEARK